MATVTEELVYEYWDCDKCGQKAIRGDVRTCPSCGNARNENIKFYLMEGKEEKVEDKALADKFKAGADWLCSFCETLNSVTDNNCLSCGASQESSKKNYFEVQKEKELKAAKKAPIENPKKPFNWKKFSIWGLSFLGSLYHFFVFSWQDS
jgi:ribosomal protein L37E